MSQCADLEGGEGGKGFGPRGVPRYFHTYVGSSHFWGFKITHYYVLMNSFFKINNIVFHSLKILANSKGLMAFHQGLHCLPKKSRLEVTLQRVYDEGLMCPTDD